jgi:hypothetical protein
MTPKEEPVSTNSTENARSEGSDSRTLMEQARAQPGVEAVVEVYRRYRAVEQAARPYMRAVQGRHIVSASDTSNPSRW